MPTTLESANQRLTNLPAAVNPRFRLHQSATEYIFFFNFSSVTSLFLLSASRRHWAEQSMAMEEMQVEEMAVETSPTRMPSKISGGNSTARKKAIYELGQPSESDTGEDEDTHIAAAASSKLPIFKHKKRWYYCESLIHWQNLFMLAPGNVQIKPKHPNLKKQSVKTFFSEYMIVIFLFFYFVGCGPPFPMIICKIQKQHTNFRGDLPKKAISSPRLIYPCTYHLTLAA